MSKDLSIYRPEFFALGDSALTVDFGNRVDANLNDQALTLYAWIMAHPFEGLTDCIAAYSSVSVFYNPITVSRHYPASGPAFEWVKARIRLGWEESAKISPPAGRDFSDARTPEPENTPAGLKSRQIPPTGPEPIRIPVCYEGHCAPDLDGVAAQKGLSKEEMIEIHGAGVYRVYMIGFLPGFAYMGDLPEILATPRKSRPAMVTAGSVGITGRQTGIYPLSSPGGWNIIGRTPLRLFDPRLDPPVLLKMGDRVQFYPITLKEFGGTSLL